MRHTDATTPDARERGGLRVRMRGRGRRRSEGVVVEATILARLLRVRLLRLDASVVILPADMDERPAPTRAPPTRAATLPPAASDGRGALAEAVRAIEQSAAILAETRQRGRGRG